MLAIIECVRMYHAWKPVTLLMMIQVLILRILPDLLNLYCPRFLNISSNLLATKRCRSSEVIPGRCVGADTVFIGKARCKLCIEKADYVSAKSGTNSLSYHLQKAHAEFDSSLNILLQSWRLRLAMIFAVLKGLRKKDPLIEKSRVPRFDDPMDYGGIDTFSCSRDLSVSDYGEHGQWKSKRIWHDQN